jgi:hypothetical protein
VCSFGANVVVVCGHCVGWDGVVECVAGAVCLLLGGSGAGCAWVVAAAL